MLVPDVIFEQVALLGETHVCLYEGSPRSELSIYLSILKVRSNRVGKECGIRSWSWKGLSGAVHRSFDPARWGT